MSSKIINRAFLDALAKHPTPFTPVWFMRQAGRALRSYRELREKYSFADLMNQPELIRHITMLPIDHLGVDAAILFADLSTPLQGMGILYQIVEGRGPVLNNPIRMEKDLKRIRTINPEEDIPFLIQAIHAIKVDIRVPLIGFVGAPFTLAAYMVDGSGSKDYPKTRAMIYSMPHLWTRLMNRLVDNLILYAKAQIHAGVDAIQVFDSWLGVVSREVFTKFIRPYVVRLIKEISMEIPIIYFSTGSSSLLSEMREIPAQTIGIDWRQPLDEAWKKIGWNKGIQGNLDPAVALSDSSTIRRYTRDVLKRANGRPGHIFNLGHGILPSTPEDHLKFLVDYVHEYTLRNQS